MFGHPLNSAPYIKNEDLNRLRVRLLREEIDELNDGIIARDRVEVLDALTDIQYVLDGAVLALGYAGRVSLTVYPPATERRSESGLPAMLMGCVDLLETALQMAATASVEVALGRLQVGLSEAYSQLGFDTVRQQAFAEVHRSNMSKLGEDGKPIYDEGGKVLKGPNYSRPDLAQFVEELAA